MSELKYKVGFYPQLISAFQNLQALYFEYSELELSLGEEEKQRLEALKENLAKTLGFVAVNPETDTSQPTDVVPLLPADQDFSDTSHIAA